MAACMQVLFDFLDCSEDVQPGTYRLVSPSATSGCLGSCGVMLIIEPDILENMQCPL